MGLRGFWDDLQKATKLHDKNQFSIAVLVRSHENHSAHCLIRATLMS